MRRTGIIEIETRIKKSNPILAMVIIGKKDKTVLEIKNDTA